MTNTDIILPQGEVEVAEEFRYPAPAVIAAMSAEKFHKLIDASLHFEFDRAGADRAKWDALGVRLARIHHNWSQNDQRLSKSVIERLFKECPFRIVTLEFSVKTGLEMAEKVPVRLVVDNTRPQKAARLRLRKSKTPEQKAADARQLKANREKRAEKNRERAHGGTGVAARRKDKGH